ncbi:ribosome quality control complex subunit TCF25-like [Lineus longissimus]|uniref:ribosome quality control complex subunit TCF25-like n=1 Tax=Lineus longissimus TaxID=88925 RepID=UPI002B4E0818
MSSRALRKLRKDQDSVVPDLVAGNADNEELDDHLPQNIVKSKKSKSKNKGKAVANPFDLLNEDGDENDVDIPLPGDEDSGQDKENTEEVNTGAVKKKKRKKKKKSKNMESEATDGNDQKEDEDIEAVIKEVNDMYGDIGCHGKTDANQEHMTTMTMRALLNVEHKHLNPDTEMRRIFGSRVVQSEQTRRNRNRNRQYHKSTWLAHPKDTWPPMGKTGLSMRLLETKQGNQFFAFEHNQAYQEIEFKFLDAVESFDPQNIVNVLNLQSYHINSLLQLSEVCKMSEDIQMATEFIERALYSFECCFHSLFSLTQGRCRLDYRRPENRAFYIALFRQLIFVGQKGCYRTALEFCKLILSLDPDNDPLCILLMLDFYALRSDQYAFLVRMYQEWEAHRNLTFLPNFGFSMPLAMFHLALQGDGDFSQADDMLQNSLLMFPGLLLPLLEECSVKPDPQVAAHSFFRNSQQSQPDALRQLIALYVGRCSSCWKAPEVMEWLERNVAETMQRIGRQDPKIKEYEEKRNIRYRGTPRNIYRHIVISEIKDAKAALPPELAVTPIMSYDPLPPTDSIISYTRPERQGRLHDPSVLNMFFRSLMPNFDVQNPPTSDGAVGGEDQATIRQSVGSLMDAMRNMLANIQPVPPPVENGENQDDEEEEGAWEL